MLKCSHILCKVGNLAHTVASLQQAGFNIQWGSDPARAHNALLWFNQGPFIEFFAFPRCFAAFALPFGLRHGRAAGQRLAWWAKAPPGWCDVALEPQVYPQANPLELTPVRQWLQTLAINRSRIIRGRRIDAQGTAVHYRFLAPAPVTLPFIVSHYQPLQRPADIHHPNGVSGVARVDIDLSAADCARLRQMLPDDRWLFANTGIPRQSPAVQLHGWHDQPDADPFIRSLFMPAMQEEICKQ